MFSVIIPIHKLSHFVINNARILAQSKQVRSIFLINNSGEFLELDVKISKTQVLQLYNESSYSSIFKTIKDHVKSKNVILLDNNIQVGNSFISKLVTHYADNHLYTFKVNKMKGNSVIVDNRIGNKLTPEMFHTCAVAFGRSNAVTTDGFGDGDLIDFVYKMMANDVTIKQLNQVLCHKVNEQSTNIIIEQNNKARKKRYELKALATTKRKKKDHPPVKDRSCKPEYKYKQGKFEMINVNDKPKVKYSFIIPFMYSGDRFPLFEATIKRLYTLTRGHDSIEIVVHESGPSKRLTYDFIKKYDISYIYNEYHDLFHRAWNLNVSARHIAQGDYYIFIDADLIIDEKWIEELFDIEPTKCYIGWSRINNLSPDATKYHLQTGQLQEIYTRVRIIPNIHRGAAAGVNIIPKKIFWDIGGWCEDYAGCGYGGGDNSFSLKLDKLGYGYIPFKATIWHLHHSHQSKRFLYRHKILDAHEKRTTQKWIDSLLDYKAYNWGYCKSLEIEGTYNPKRFPNTEHYFSHALMYAFTQSKKPLITICMVNYRRHDTLFDTISNYKEIGANVNLLLWMNGSDDIPKDILEKIHKMCKKSFVSYEIFLNKENSGTAKGRNFMLKKAYEEYDTPYIMTTDDDIIFKDLGSLMVSATVLHQQKFKDFGAMAIGCKPLKALVKVLDKKMVKVVPKTGIQKADVLGAATMMIRREVLKDCNVDKSYPRVGFVDWDFSLEITDRDWLLGLLYEDHYVAFNNAYEGDTKYNKGRYDKSLIQQSYHIFKSKWNIEPIIGAHWLT